ncbi:FadR/GntR family transcriptional regulator [Anaerobacillus sp. MEB173]|uniref:FadR/GntR family transcriptional regulator n=1 Tax=Anaerobacillus sp. MEB173 TaxID=3383345 RepID=UPI003F8E7B1B
MPIQRRRVSELVLEEIKKLIKKGEFKPNTKLPSENELAKMFQVSRVPIREAISVLAAGGIVEPRQGGGNWIREVDFANMMEKVTIEMVDIKQLLDLLEFRIIVEAEAAALAAERYKQEDIEQLEAALDVFRKSTIDDENTIGDQADYTFHQIIVKASYNPFLMQTIDNISDLYQKYLKFSLKKNIGFKMKREQVYGEHKSIFEAIKERDANTAHMKMKEHLQNTKQKLEKLKIEE